MTFLGSGTMFFGLRVTSLGFGGTFLRQRTTGTAGGIDVDDLDILANRARPEFFPRDLECKLVDRRGLETGGEAGIECEDPESAGYGLFCHGAYHPRAMAYATSSSENASALA
jgi:hypothetical protein